MKMHVKKALTVFMAVTVLSASAFALGGIHISDSPKTVYAETVQGKSAYTGATPKYIFLFIGDGMSYPQITSATDYLGKVQYGDSKVSDTKLGFMKFPLAGSATTFDSTSFCPDSASTATSISTGNKTHSGIINMDEDKKTTYETISEKLKKQLGYKIGIVSSVSIDHATPAAFYAHQPSRGNYYEIATELTKSGFD